MRSRVLLSLLATALLISVAAFAQQTTGSDAPQDSSAAASQNNQQIQTTPMAQTPVYRVNVVERTARAVDYRGRANTQVDIRGTQLEPQITGDAKVDSHTGRMAVNVAVHHLQSARTFGPMYLTYVLWAITPEGRAVNLGEVVPNDDHDASLQVTTPLQAFGLVITAEPYFAVTQPSDMVVAENVIPQNVKGWPRPIDAKFELLKRDQYAVNLNPADLPSTQADKRTPLDLLEARNAVAIARAAGADQYASDTMKKAEDDLNRAEDYNRRHQGSGPIATMARAAAQAAEDARLLTIDRKQQESAQAAQQQMQERIQNAKSEAEAAQERAQLARMKADEEAQQRAQAEQEREAAQRAAEAARQEREAAQQALQQAQQARQQAELQAQQTQQQAALQQQQLQQQAQQAQQQAEQARLQAQQAEQARQRVEQQAQQQRARLMQQLNEVLQTRETARGLVSRMPDVLFALNKATLRPDAKIKLAKVAGIIMAYPDLKLEIDGYTDSTGTQQHNEVLSQERAAAVRDFLISQGVSVNNVIARGFGPSNPIASNATAQGRQLNRRVEMVVSGTAIGMTTQPTTTTTGGEATSASGNGNGNGATGGVSGTAAQTGTATSTTGSGTAVGAPAGTSSEATSPASSTPTSSGNGSMSGSSSMSPATSSPASSPSTSSPTSTPPTSSVPPRH